MVGPIKGIAVLAVLIAWTLGGLASLDLLPKDIARHFNGPKKWVTLLWGVAVLLIVVGLFSYFAARPGFFYDFSKEMVVAGFSVLVIDGLRGLRSAQEYKRHIVQQMASQSNEFALEAVRVAGKMEWLRDGSLNGIDLTNVNLVRMDLRKANLKNADIRNANLKDATLYAVDFENADMRGIHLEGATILVSQFKRATLWNARINGAHIEGGSFENADLPETNLEGATFRDVTFAGADIQRANLRETTLHNVNFVGATYSVETKWPDGFDPQSAGAINWDELSRQEQLEWLSTYRTKQS